MFPYFVSSLRSPCYRPPSRPGHDFFFFFTNPRVFKSLHDNLLSRRCEGVGMLGVSLVGGVSDNKEFPLRHHQYIFIQLAWPRFLRSGQFDIHIISILLYGQ